MTIQTTHIKETKDTSKKCYRQPFGYDIIPHIVLISYHHDITDILLRIKELIRRSAFIHTHIATKVTSVLYICPTANATTIITYIKNILYDP